MIDSHCHLDMPAFDLDREAVWARARTTGVRAVIIPSVEPARWSATHALARAGERYIALGIHPQCVADLDDATIALALDALPERLHATNAVAVGECGLDGTVDLARQSRTLLAQIEVARTLDLPLILHVYRAHAEAIALLRGVALPRAGGVVHSYSGGVERLRDYLALGLHVSFAGGVTRPNARKPVDAARAVPSDRLLLETDAPDQPPTGSTHTRCEPADLAITAAHLARIRGVAVDTLIADTDRNAERLFSLGV